MGLNIVFRCGLTSAGCSYMFLWTLHWNFQFLKLQRMFFYYRRYYLGFVERHEQTYASLKLSHSTCNTSSPHFTGIDSVILHAYANTVFLSIPCMFLLNFRAFIRRAICLLQVESRLRTIIVPQVWMNGIPRAHNTIHCFSLVTPHEWESSKNPLLGPCNFRSAAFHLHPPYPKEIPLILLWMGLSPHEKFCPWTVSRLSFL